MPKKVTQTVIETKNEENDSSQDELLQKMDEFFEGISTGCTVGVYREQPKNLQSFLEEIELSDGNNPVDMEYLKNKWGGRVLKLIIRGEDGKFFRRILIPMRSYPPKVEGQVIPEWGPLIPNPAESQPIQRVEQSNPIDMFRQMNEILKSNSQPVSSGDTMAAIMVPLMQSLIERSFQQPVPQPSGSTSSLIETMQAMKQMRDFIAPQFDRPQSDGGDNENSNPMLMKLMDIGQAIVERRSQPKQAMLQPPSNVHQMPIPTNLHPQLSEPPQLKTDDSSPFTVDDAGKLRNFLSNLKGKEAAALFFETIQGLPVSEQEAAIDSVAKGLGFEEFSDDEPNAVSDSNGNNAGNSPSDRAGNT